MQNKANLLDTQMNVTSAHITSYQLPITNYQYAKQTQTKPILSASGGFKRPLAKEGHHEFLFIDKINALGYYIIKVCCEKSLFERERL